MLKSASRGVFPKGTTVAEIKSYVKGIINSDPVYVHRALDHTFVIKFAEESHLQAVLDSRALSREKIPPAIVPWSEDSSALQVRASMKIIRVELPGLQLENLLLAEKMVAEVGKIVVCPKIPEDFYKSGYLCFKVLVHSIDSLPEKIRVEVPSSPGLFFIQNYNYPALPFRCKICGCRSHLQNNCPEKFPWKAAEHWLFGRVGSVLCCSRI